MIGDEYLQVRAQLGTALFSLSTLAHGLEMGRDVLQTLHDLRANLREPFLFIMLGDAQSGKTSLANALFGREILPAGAQQAGDKVHLFKYGPEEQTVQVNDHLAEYQHPDTLLRDFNIVEVPGTIRPEEEAVIGQFLPAAELVLFVFSINNPWEPSAWELLRAISTTPAKNVIFVLQQCDLRDDFEVNAVTRHLEQTLHEKFSPDCRIFPISAKKAYLSKTTGADKEGLLQQSGFSALESYINDTVIQSDERKESLRHICHTGKTILADTGKKNKETLAFIKREIEQLGELNFDLEERKEQSLRQVNGVLWTLAQSYERLQKQGEQLLQELLPISLIPKFKATPPKEKIPQSPDAEMQESIQRQIQSSIELLTADFQKAWRQLHESVGKRFSTGAEATPPGEFARDRAELLQGIQSTLMENMSEVHQRWQMTEFFTETAEWLHIHRDAGPSGATTALACFIAGDFSRALGEAATSAGSIRGLMKRGKIQARFRMEMAKRREELLATVETHLRRATGQFYKEACESLQPLQVFHTAQKTIYEARTATVTQIMETFAQTERTLGPGW